MPGDPLERCVREDEVEPLFIFASSRDIGLCPVRPGIALARGLQHGRERNRVP